MPFVTNQAATMERARPSRPVCSSHNFRFQIKDLGVPTGTVAPGTNMRQTTAIMTMGARIPTMARSQTGTVSLTVKGKLPSCQF
jgi:hypothetical protein